APRKTSNAGEAASSKALDLNMPNREVLQDCCNPDFFNTIGGTLPFESVGGNEHSAPSPDLHCQQRERCVSVP
ncbi:hypothetical protein, partial [Mesorhizobium sp. M0768]|uniref:hypothetical protein n=1 Tax=Mesorhizobium sp. M0768 TaxID=2956996 RepID=UPI003339C7B8